jgi:C1A family cysteine protease
MSTVLKRVSGYGWQSDTPDDRDRLYHKTHEVIDPAKLSRFPAKLNLWANCPPIYNQLQLGGCVGNGVARVMGYQENDQAEGMVTPSRLFIYGNARKIEGTYATDSGAQIRDGIKGVVEWGAPPETLWPYSDANPGPFNEPIPASVYTAGAKELAIQYSKIVIGTPGAPLRTAIYNGTPIVFGFSVPSFFEDGSWDPATQFLPLPNGQASFIGGHCVVATGYDWTCDQFSEPVVWCDNSWGEDWGFGGRFAMDARYFTSLATDLWVVEKVS